MPTKTPPEDVADEEGAPHHRSAHWQKLLTLLKDEARWLAETLGIVTVTLVIGRILKVMGIDVATVSSTSWTDIVNRVLQPEHTQPEENHNEDR